MTRMHRPASLGILCFIFFIANSILATTIRAADQQSPGKQLLAADDFWDKTGRQTAHGLDEEVVAEIKRLAANMQTDPALRLRAFKVLCDLAGHTRLSGEIANPDATHAMAAAFKHMETHLTDPFVRKFSPALGFTHVSVSRMSGDGAIWVLVESVEDARQGGLNIRVDPTTWQVTRIDHWGKVAP